MKNGFKATVISLVAILTLSACAPSYPVYDDSNWVDDSANRITLNLTGVELSDGVSNEAASAIQSISSKIADATSLYTLTGGHLLTTIFIQQSNRTFVRSNAVNPFYDVENGYGEVLALCEVKDSKFVRLYDDFTVDKMLLELNNEQIDYSFKTHNRVVLIETTDEPFIGTSALTRVFVISFQKDFTLDSVSVAYMGEKFNGEDFNAFYQEALKEEGLYYRGFIDFKADYSELLLEDIETSFLLQMPKENIKDSLYSLVVEDEQSYNFSEYNYNEASGSCSKVQDFTVKVREKSK